MDLRNNTTSEFRTVFDSPLGVPNSEVSLYIFLSQTILFTRLLGSIPFSAVTVSHSFRTTRRAFYVQLLIIENCVY